MIRAAARICLVRHGQTAWNSERCIQGQLDVHLNADGMARARALAGSLLSESCEAIYSSDPTRARWRSRHPEDLSRFECRDVGHVMPGAALSWIDPEGRRWPLLGRADNADLTGALGELAG